MSRVDVGVVDSLTLERWLPVVGSEGRYEVSSAGRVRSLPRARTAGHPLKGTPHPGGYVLVAIDGRKRKIHDLVLQAFIGPRPLGAVTRHLDNDPTNNRVENLRWGTQRENMLDRVEHGTSLRQTHCKRGHELNDENVIIRHGRRRGCRLCKKELDRGRGWG